MMSNAALTCTFMCIGFLASLIYAYNLNQTHKKVLDDLKQTNANLRQKLIDLNIKLSHVKGKPQQNHPYDFLHEDVRDICYSLKTSPSQIIEKEKND
jgi:hypothetical protein